MMLCFVSKNTDEGSALNNGRKNSMQRAGRLLPILGSHTMHNLDRATKA